MIIAVNDNYNTLDNLIEHNTSPKQRLVKKRYVDLAAKKIHYE